VKWRRRPKAFKRVLQLSVREVDSQGLPLKYLSVAGLNYVWTKVAAMGGTVNQGYCEQYKEKRIGDAARCKTE
jgi:hypothetical protein